MFDWALLTVALLMLALLFREAAPSSLVAVSLYKLHLMALAGWGGYWLDRALFPYDRPHQYLELADDKRTAEDDARAEIVAGNAFGMSMLRRAVIVAACLVCVALGA
jgi:hypothetical protein